MNASTKNNTAGWGKSFGRTEKHVQIKQNMPWRNEKVYKENWYEHKPKESSRRSGHAWKNTSWIKPQCQFLIGIEEERQFQVTRRLLSSHGKHVKAIAEESGAKLRLRGKGSGFLEGPEKLESTDPLMMCVSAQDQESYSKAKSLVWSLLEDVHKQYWLYCEKVGHPLPELHVDVHEGPRRGSY